MATHSGILAWRIPGTGEPGGLPSMGSHRVGHNWSDLAAAAWWYTRPSRTKTRKRCPFYHRGLECKSKKSKDTWNNRKFGLGSTKWNRGKAKRFLPREHTGHSKHPLPTTQQMTLHMDITRWSILKSYWLYSLQQKMENLHTVSQNKTRNWLWLKSWTPECKVGLGGVYWFGCTLGHRIYHSAKEPRKC